MNPDIHRQMPYSQEAEQGLLGSMLIAPQEVMPDASTRIKVEAFYEPRHQTIFSLLVELWTQQKPADPITLVHVLRDRKQLEAIGGHAYLSRLIDNTPTAANAGYYLDIVKEKHTLRRIIATCTECASLAYDQQETSFTEVSEKMQQLLTSLSQEASTGSGVVPMKELVSEAIDRIQARHEGKGKLRGISSGLGLLDKLTGGWQGGQMILLCAPEKQGKSSIARQFILEAAVVREIPTAIFSHEMNRHEIVDALIPTRSRVDIRLIEDGLLRDGDFAKITKAAIELGNAPIFIFDESDSTILQFRANCRRAVREFNCGLIVLDFLQLIGGSDEGKERQREERISEVGRNCKLAAKELNVPIIVLSQLNKDGETQYARAVQQHCDKKIVINHEDPKAEGEGKAWVIVELSRNGPKGKVPVTWRPTLTVFDPLANED